MARLYINQWDKAYKLLQHRVAELERPYLPETIALVTSLLQKDAAILQYQAAIDSLINDIDYAKAKNFSSAPKPTAIIHWAASVARLIQVTYTKFSSFLAKRLWVALIRFRINSASRDFLTLMDDGDLLAMGTRELELINLEKRLTKDLMAIGHRKKELVYTYQQLDAKASNADAAQCLQRNWRDSLGTPDIAHSTLKSFINNLSTNTRAASNSGEQLKKLERELVRRTDSVMADCRQLISKDIDPNKLTIGDQRLTKLQGDLSQLEDLQREVEALKTKAKNDAVPVLHPIMVKNSQKQAKRPNR